jgi:hypothetical protein
MADRSKKDAPSAKATRAKSIQAKPRTKRTVKTPAPRADTLFGSSFYKERKTFQRPDTQEAEIIVACFLLTENYSEVSRMTGWSIDIIKTQVKKAEESGELWNRHVKNREKFIDVAWDGVMLAAQTVVDGLRKGYVNGAIEVESGEVVNLVSKVGPGEAAGVLHKLHHAIQLASGKPTSIVQEIAENATREEIWAEAERLRQKLEETRGKLN